MNVHVWSKVDADNDGVTFPNVTNIEYDETFLILNQIDGKRITYIPIDEIGKIVTDAS